MMHVRLLLLLLLITLSLPPSSIMYKVTSMGREMGLSHRTSHCCARRIGLLLCRFQQLWKVTADKTGFEAYVRSTDNVLEAMIRNDRYLTGSERKDVFLLLRSLSYTSILSPHFAIILISQGSSRVVSLNVASSPSRQALKRHMINVRRSNGYVKGSARKEQQPEL
eukprot:jgi/Bigna1/68813/fgenesh1_pg.7_\